VRSEERMGHVSKRKKESKGHSQSVGGEGGMTLDIERRRKGEGYSRTVERGGKDKSGHQVRESEGHTSCRAQGEGQVRNQEDSCNGTLTSCRVQMEKLTQNTKRKRESEWHSRTVEHRGWDKLGHQEK
jgi:hypothetical protein